MATKTFEELKQMAIQIRDEKTNKQNTATRIGTQMLEHLNKLEQEYYDKTTLDKRVTELNISELYPTQGIGGSNKYDLATAIAQVPAEYRSILGLKVTFTNNETSLTETWVYKGPNWVTASFTQFDINNINPRVDKLDNLTGLFTCSSAANNSNRVVNGSPYIEAGKTRLLIVMQNKLSLTTPANLQFSNGNLYPLYYNDIRASSNNSWDDNDILEVYFDGTNYQSKKYIVDDRKFNHLYLGSYTSKTEARNSVPEKMRRQLLVISYICNDELISEKFIGTNVSTIDWNYSFNWLTVLSDDLINDRINKIVSIPFEISNYKSGVINSDGSITPQSNATYAIKKLPIDNYIFNNLKGFGSSNTIIAAWYKGEDEFISSIATYEKANQVVNTLIINSDDAPTDAEYILVNTKADNNTKFNYIYTIQQIKEFVEESNLIQNNNLMNSVATTLSFERYKNASVMRPDGTIGSGGNGYEIYKFPIEGGGYFFDKLISSGGDTGMIGWYKGEDEFISMYLTAGANQTLTDIVVFMSEAPTDAEYMLVFSRSYKPIVKELNVSKLNERVSKLEDSVSNADFSAGQNIYGIGDSIGSQILAALVKNIGSIDGHTVVNGCVGGETTLDTLAKNNVIPYIVTPFTIPATTTQSEAVNVYSSRYLRTVIAEDGETLTYVDTFKKGYDGAGEGIYNAINSWNNIECNIGGVDGTLYFIRNNPNRANNYFIRDLAGEEVVFDRPQLVIPKNLQSKQCIWIDFMGTNGGWTPLDTASDFYKSADILVNYYEQLRNYFNHENYVFLGFYMTAFLDQTTGEERVKRWKYFEDKMVEKFGKHYLSVRQYLREYGWRDAGYKLGYRLVDDPEGGEGAKKYTCLPEDIEADIQAIKDGKIPYCIVNGTSGVHMLAKPSACVANQVIKRLYELGCINSCPQIDISTIQDAENADINEPDYGG